MFDVGFWELAVIGVTALIVVGPERLPGLARTAGRYVGDAQRIIQRVRLEFEREMDAEEYRQQHADLERRLREAQQALDLNAAAPAAPSPAPEPTPTPAVTGAADGLATSAEEASGHARHTTH